MGKRLKKKHIGYGDFFCWNCGKRIIKNKRKCPYCNVWYSGERKYSSPELIKQVTPGIHDPSIRRYNFRKFFGYFIFIAGFSALLPLIIWAGDMGKTDFEYIINEVWIKIVAVLCTFWIIWIILQEAGSRKRIRKIAGLNRNSPEEITCVSCGAVCSRHENYCSRCGSVLIK